MRTDVSPCLSAVIARSESDVAIQSRGRGPGLPRRGACHRAALCADPLAPRNDGVGCLKIESGWCYRRCPLTVTLRRRREAAASKGDGPALAARAFILRGSLSRAPQDDGLQ